MFVYLYTRTNHWKWGLQKPFLMLWRFFVDCKKYFGTQTLTSLFPQNNWSTGNAAPELIQEFGPGNQNNKSVELLSPIATFSLQTQLNIHWFATRRIIYSVLCLLELVFCLSSPFQRVCSGKGNKILTKLSSTDESRFSYLERKKSQTLTFYGEFCFLFSVHLQRQSTSFFCNGESQHLLR